LVAHHWDLGGEVEPAARWHRRAAQWIAGNNATEARRHWNRVRELAEKIGDPVLALELGQQSRLMMLEYGWRLGVPAAEVDDLLREGEAWAQRNEDTRALAALYNAFTIPCAFIIGDLRRAHELATTGLRIAEQVGDSALACALELRLYFVAEGFGRVADMASAMDAVSRRTPDDMERASPLVGYCVPALVAGWCWREVWSGRLDAAHDRLRRGIELARARGAVEVTGWLLTQESELWYERGDATRANVTASEGVEIAERIESPLSQGMALHAFGRSLALAGDTGAAVAALERALEFVQRVLLQREPEVLSDLASAHCALGSLAEAEATAARALELAVKRETLRGEACALSALASIHLARGNEGAVEEARRLLDRAQSGAEEVGQRVLLPRIYELRAEVEGRKRNSAGAEAALGEAQRLYREMGAPLQAERLAKDLGA
jgi:adenylate cyclase